MKQTVALFGFLGAVLLGCQDGRVSPAVAKALDVFECQLEVTQAALPHLAAAEDLVMASRAGKLDYVIAQLQAFGLSLDEITALGEATQSCLR